MGERLTRIVMTVDAIGGVWRYAIDLAAGLAARDIAVTLAVIGPAPNDAQNAEVAAISGVRLLITGEELDWRAQTSAEVERTARVVRDIAAQARADLVHVNSPALLASTAMPAPTIAVNHSCVATWWDAVRGAQAMPPDFVWRAALHARGLRNADLTVAPSAAFARLSEQRHGLAPMRVVHNCVAPRNVAHDAAAPFVFTAGRLWDEAKNVFALERVASRLSAPVLAAGPLRAPHGASTRLSATQTLGSLDQTALRGLLDRRPVFVSMARYEPFGLAVLEAAQAGCALVLSDMPTFREIWEGCAVFVPLDDEAALVHAINDLLADDAARAAAGERAQARAARYSHASFVDSMCALYDNVLLKQGRAA